MSVSAPLLFRIGVEKNIKKPFLFLFFFITMNILLDFNIRIIWFRATKKLQSGL